MVQAPIEVFLEHATGAELAGLLALQAFWAAVLLLAGRAASRPARASWCCKVGESAALLGIYRRLIGARIRAQLQYRLSFALNLVGNALITFLDFAAILIVFGQVDALGGWTVGEVAVLYGISASRSR